MIARYCQGQGHFKPTNTTRNHTTQPQEVAQNKKQARANRQRFQDNRDKYLEEMRQAFKLMQLKYGGGRKQSID